MVDEEVWKQRFGLFALSRLIGVILIVGGVAITFSDLLRPGGWPVLGGVLILFGLLDALVAPKLLKKHWDRLDNPPQGRPNEK